MADPVRAGFDRLLSDQEAARATAVADLAVSDDLYFEAYRNLVSLNAWRQYILEPSMPPSALAFFVEAQNDGLVALLLARSGMWRTSLQCLRSVIEHVYAALYFKDHPVEWELWAQGRFRIGAANLREYFEHHPRTAGVRKSVTGQDLLEAEYVTLSRAVHASGASFRMTSGDGDIPVLYSGDKPSAGKWATNQRRVLQGVNLLLIAMYSDQMVGAAHANVRSALSLVVTAKQRTLVKGQWKVSIPSI